MKAQRIWKWIFVGIGLFYFIWPRDLIPDFGWIGRIDDFLVISYLMWRYFRQHPAAQPEQNSASEPLDGPQPGRTAHEVLGVSADADKKEIRNAYRKLIAQYHPDKVEHLGQEFQDIAHEKMIEIQRAYEQLSKHN